MVSNPVAVAASDGDLLRYSSLRLAFLLIVDGLLLFLILMGKVSFAHPGVQREGEGGVNGDRELEHLALTCQCLAEVQALGGQGGVIEDV